MTLQLFDRIFRQPPTANVLPAENMATEITAYLLEHHHTLRGKLLNHLGIEPSDGWEVETQCCLPGPIGAEWRGKIPDIILRHSVRGIMIVVEVKIDAGVTFSLSCEGALIPQTQCYRSYLNAPASLQEYPLAHLVTLTRWSPPASFSDAVALRFTHIARWLREEQGSTPVDAAIAWLGRQWSDYLYAQRWAMTPIRQAHVASVAPFLELQASIRDTLAAVNDAMLAGQTNWRRVGKASDSFKTNEIYFASPALEHLGSKADGIQCAIYLGVEDGSSFVQPGVYIFNPTLDYPALFPEYSHQAIPSWNGHRIKFSNLCVSDDNGEDPWSAVVKQLLDVVLRVDRALVLSKQS